MKLPTGRLLISIPSLSLKVSGLDAEKLTNVQREMDALSEGVKFVYNSVDDPSTVHDLAEKLKKSTSNFGR